MIKQLKNLLVPVVLSEDAHEYFFEQYLKRAIYSVKYAVATIVLLLYFELPNANVVAITVWGVIAITLQIGRGVFAKRELLLSEVRHQQLFYFTEVLGAVCWVAFIYVFGWNENNEMLTLWRCSIIFIVMVFYLDCIRYSKFSLFVYSLVICLGMLVYFYEFNLIAEAVRIRFAIILIFGTFVVLMYGRSSYLMNYEAYQVLTENKRLLHAMDDMLTHDELTKQHNRRYFTSQLSHYLALFERKQQDFCVAILDIDFFKRVNDTHGHATGDAALIELSTYIKNRLRACDIFARYGGEEFVVLLPETNLDTSLMVLDRLREHVSTKEFNIKGTKISLTISAGVAVVESGDTTELLLERADNALYQAKENGRNRTVPA